MLAISVKVATIGKYRTKTMENIPKMNPKQNIKKDSYALFQNRYTHGKNVTAGEKLTIIK